MNINILVFDSEVNLENDKIFPLGNLRESPLSAINRADFLICIGSSVSSKNLSETFFQDHNPEIIGGEFKPHFAPILKKRKLIAFCGIGRPEKFFSMLRKLNHQVIEEFSFPDHHFYAERQLVNILDVAKKNNALVVTTKKDFVKIPSKFKKIIHTIDIELHLPQNEKLLSKLKSLVC